MYKYKIFGLKVLSDIKLDCFFIDFDKPEVIIQESDIGGICDVQKFIKISPTHSILNMSGIAKYDITNGNQINYKKDYGAKNDEFVLYLLGTVFGTLMMQRNEFPLHGSVVKKEDVCIAILGNSGAGKSSLAVGLSLDGWEILTDDVIRTNLFGHSVHVNCSYPSSKLWDKSLDELGLNSSGLNAVVKKENKFYYKNDDIYSRSPELLNYTIELVPGDVDEVTIVTLNLKETLELLIRNSYRYFVLEYSGQISDHFKYMSRICSKVKGYRIIRPTDRFTVKDQIKLINEVIRGDLDEEICI